MKNGNMNFLRSQALAAKDASEGSSKAHCMKGMNDFHKQRNVDNAMINEALHARRPDRVV
jgi:hypothetical protein